MHAYFLTLVGSFLVEIVLRMSKGIIAFLVLAFENKSINGSRGRLASQVSGKEIITINTLSIRLLGPQQFLKTFSQHDNNLNKSNFLSVPLFFLSIFIIPLRIQQRSKMHYKAKPKFIHCIVYTTLHVFLFVKRNECVWKMELFVLTCFIRILLGSPHTNLSKPSMDSGEMEL